MPPINTQILSAEHKVLAMRMLSLDGTSKGLDRLPDKTYAIGSRSLDCSAEDVDGLAAAHVFPMSFLDDGGQHYSISRELLSLAKTSFGLGRKRFILELVYGLVKGKAWEWASWEELESLLSPIGVTAHDLRAYGFSMRESGVLGKDDVRGLQLTPDGKLAVEEPPATSTPSQSFTINGNVKNLQAIAQNFGQATQNAEAAELLAQVKELVDSLAEAVTQSLPPEDAADVVRDAQAVADELAKEHPDGDAVAKRSRSILGKIQESLRSGAEMAENADKIGNVILKYGALVMVAGKALGMS